MIIPYLRPSDSFPSPQMADSQGLLAYSESFSPEKITEAYYQGIFPWYEEGQPVLWWSPDPRMVLFPSNLHISKSMRQLLKQKKFRLTYNQCFERVIKACAKIPRNGQEGTWITSEIIEVYTELHRQGIAHSVEIWDENQLVGGLYGIYLKEKQVFCGESMFSKVSNASKYAFISLVKKLKKEKVKLIDCQVYTPHLESLGAKEIPREQFLAYLV